jgi:hypothetical protein
VLDRAAITSLADGSHDVRITLSSQEFVEDETNYLGFRFVNLQSLLRRYVSEGRKAAVHLSVAFPRSDAVTDTLCDEFALELRESEQDVEDHPAHAVGGVECLRDGNERYVVPIKYLDKPNKVSKASCEPIDFVDDNDIDFPFLDVMHKP